jgi:hypothetical protein
MNRDFSTLRAALEKMPSFGIITDMVTFAYRYRLYPTRTQEVKLCGWLESLRLVYNFALAERREAYKTEKRSLSVYEQKRALPDLKKRFSRYAGINSDASLQEVGIHASKERVATVHLLTHRQPRFAFQVTAIRSGFPV